MKTAIITGIAGQDGAYLSKLLISKGYKVIGCHHNKYEVNFWRLDKLGLGNKLILEYLDLKLFDVIDNLIYRYKPDELYNLAGLSSVSKSFSFPTAAVDVNGVAVTRLLEAIRQISPRTKYYQASSSEMFGRVSKLPITEETRFSPLSPYAAAKILAHNMVSIYREAYGMYACSGILFNHESPLRGDNFVTSKIIKTIKQIKNGSETPLILGNIYAKRDWGYAKEYVYGMWSILQQAIPDDYILATGKSYSVKEFVTIAFEAVGIEIFWQGKGLQEVAKEVITNKTVVKISEEFYRPTDIINIYGDASKAETHFNWKAKVGLKKLILLMLEQLP